MSPVGLVFVGLISVALAKPGLISGPLIARLTPAASVGLDGRVLDTPEVAVAKAEHAAAQLNERINLANEAARSSGVLQATVVRPSSLVVSAPTVLIPGAPVGPDGRVVDTQEVAIAKAAHAAAQVNERINLANEAARSVAADVNRRVVPLVASGLIAAIPGAAVGPDGRVLDTPEVAAAKAAHAAAQINERISLVNEAVRSSGTVVTAGQAVSVPLVAANAVVVPGAPIGPDGRVQDTAEVAVAKAAHASAHLNEKLNLVNEAARSADVLAIASPSVAYGRLVY
ncbi:PREDICTED: cuticle protein 18.7-like [Dufourea novaeangliae]|uniref:cuticle protein 18.7-like n=1 Tax=Dufourea novaeangliae TaxID=178035 RepID=UPI000766E44E|nr:PREDICTED: cuticle protein 18.7-like [Dufourea novaeangliae]